MSDATFSSLLNSSSPLYPCSITFYSSVTFSNARNEFTIRLARSHPSALPGQTLPLSPVAIAAEVVTPIPVPMVSITAAATPTAAMMIRPAPTVVVVVATRTNLRPTATMMMHHVVMLLRRY